MTRPVGKRQLALLVNLGCPSTALVVGDKLSSSLVGRGLLKARRDGSFARITPTGLRQLADELEAGRIPDPVVRSVCEAIKRRRAERRARQ